jgi:uncharacterized protein (TIGR02147 family)
MARGTKRSIYPRVSLGVRVVSRSIAGYKEDALEAQLSIQKLLHEKFSEIRLRNPSFSLRAFAQRLDISPSALSEVLNGKRAVSEKWIPKLAERLSLSPREIKKLQKSFADTEALKTGGAKKEALKAYTEITMDQYHMISDWFHFGILSLAETADFKDEPAWIAQRLNITMSQTKSALERLERLNLLVRGKDGHLKHSGQPYSTTDEIANLALRKSHSQNLELARRSLEVDALKERDFTYITMAIDPEKIPTAKKMIRQFRDRLCAYLESEEKKEVYQMCIQMFPLTKGASDE